MVSITFEIDGLDEVRHRYNSLGEGVRESHILGRAFAEIGTVMVEDVMGTISEAFPPASEPGEPPHVRTGALRRSVRVKEASPLYVAVAAGGAGTLVPYAAALEFGTSKMEPRPFMIPAVNRLLEGGDIERILTEAMDEYVAEGTEQ